MSRASLTSIGECFSGLKTDATSPYRRVALATPRAIKIFALSLPLQAALAELGSSDDIRPRNFTMREVNVLVFSGQLIPPPVGLSLVTPPEEKEIFQRGLAAFRSLERGVHRELFFLRQGITADPEINNLSPNLYSAMLAKLADKFKDASLKYITRITFSARPFDIITTQDNGSHICFSLPQLEQHPTWARIEEIEENP